VGLLEKKLPEMWQSVGGTLNLVSALGKVFQVYRDKFIPIITSRLYRIRDSKWRK
jgi:hypothetical protein